MDALQLFPTTSMLDPRALLYTFLYLCNIGWRREFSCLVNVSQRFVATALPIHLIHGFICLARPWFDLQKIQTHISG